MLELHPLEIRERRWRIQQRIAALPEGPDKQELEAELAAIRDSCPHAHPEEDPAKGWRCRDCDLSRPPEGSEEPAAAEAAPEPLTAS